MIFNQAWCSPHSVEQKVKQGYDHLLNIKCGGFPGGSVVKNLPAMHEIQVWFLALSSSSVREVINLLPLSFALLLSKNNSFGFKPKWGWKDLCPPIKGKSWGEEIHSFLLHIYVQLQGEEIWEYFLRAGWQGGREKPHEKASGYTQGETSHSRRHALPLSILPAFALVGTGTSGILPVIFLPSF